MSRFPKITETFVLFEMQQMEQLGIHVEVYPLQRERSQVMHPQAVPFVRRAHFTPWLSSSILLAHLYFVRREPRAYLIALWTLLRANWGSLRYLIGAMVCFPKAVWFARHMQQTGVQYVHAHFASHPAAVAWVIHRLTGLPFSFTAHGSDLHRDRHMLREKVAAAAAVIAISEYNRRMIVDECQGRFAGRVHVVHCGVDLNVFHCSAGSMPRSTQAAPFRVVCVGTLHEVKGQRYLLEACRRLADRNIELECHFVGDGPDQDDLAVCAARLGLTEQVRFHGRRTTGEVRELLQSADVLVAPSVPTRDGRREGIPVVLMEALASGVAVIASDLSGIPELVVHEQTGLLTPPGNSAGIADALLRLWHDPVLRHTLADAGRATVERDFNLEANSAALADIFERAGTTA